MPTSISICSGGGLADIGLMAAGFQPIGAFEIEPAIAEVYRENIGDHITVGDVCAVNWRKVDRPDLLWASPSCRNASRANVKAGEASSDMDVAQAICRALVALRPKWFILENVGQYRDFASFRAILDQLAALGYWLSWQTVNAADWGVPQTRVRLILRATRGDCVTGGQGGLFGAGRLPELSRKEPWQGWYGAIEDLIPGLPDSQFAKWQMGRITKADRSFVMAPNSNENSWGDNRREEEEPFFSLTTNAVGRTKAFIFSNTDDQKPAYLPSTLLELGRVVSLTPRALARFQSVPDTYRLPEKSALACTVVGNGVPCLLAEKLARELMGVVN